MSRPESVSSSSASFGSSTTICRISLRFFSPPEKPSLTPRLRKLSSICISFILSLDQRQELEGVEFRLAALLADGVQRGLQQVGVVDAGNLDRVLEREEHAGAGALLGRQREQVLPEVVDGALRDLVARAAGEHAARACSCRSRSGP